MNREDILRKIRGLMQRTVDRGVTEQEAATALTLITSLMEKYDLSYEDVEEISTDKYGARVGRPAGERKRAHEINGVAFNVAAYWDCRVWRGSGGEVVFFGSADETILCHEMLHMLYVAVETEWANYKKRNALWANYKKRNALKTVHGRTLRTAFVMGMIKRLNERLVDLKSYRGRGATSLALVATRDRVVADKFVLYKRQINWNVPDDFGASSRTVKTTVKDKDAFDAGIMAGNVVHIGGRNALGT